MRKINKKTIMTGISGLVLLFALEASAQRPLPPPGTGGPEWHPGDPHEIPPGLSPMLIKALGLTDDQQEKINKLTSKAGLEGARIMARAKLKKAEIVYLWSDGSPERGRIMAKQKEAAKLAEEIKAIPVSEALGEKTKELKAKVEKLEKDLKPLAEHFEAYLAELKEKKGDVSGLELK